MTNEEIIEKLKEIVEELFPEHTQDLSKINMDTKLKEDIKFDSLSLLLMAIGIEKKFSIQMDGLNYSTINNVGNIVNYIKERI